jgi:hypothetical protein
LAKQHDRREKQQHFPHELSPKCKRSTLIGF